MRLLFTVFALPLTVSLSTAIAVAAPAAQFEGGPQKGTRTTAVSGSFNYSSKDDYSATVRVELGYYASPALEYGGGLAVNGRSNPAIVLPVESGGTAVESVSTSSGLSVAVFTRYHFGGTGRIIPYVGFAPNYQLVKSGSSKTTNLLLVGTAGADFFLKPQQSIFAEVAVLRSTGSNSSTRAQINLGLKLFY